MEEIFLRTKMVIGEENLLKLKRCKVAIFGIGGVGGYVCEALVRSGISSFILIDKDVISTTNINRQIHANLNSVGNSKTLEMKKRMESINTHIDVKTLDIFFLPDVNSDFLDDCDYIVDAVDTVTAKIEIIKIAKEKNIPVISSMGTGNKLNPAMVEVSDISKTSVCPLAKVMRKELKNRNIKNVKVVYSKENPISLKLVTNENLHKTNTPGSVCFVPAVAGFIIASEVFKDLMEV